MTDTDVTHTDVTDRPEPQLLRVAGPMQSLTDQVAAAVRDGVRSGALRPGALYSAYQLAEQLGVSRSPVREALLKLAEAGMVILERNKGFRVVTPGAREIAEVFHLRLLLEVDAAGRVAERRTPGLVAAMRAELTQMHAAAGAQDELTFMRHDQQLHNLVLAAAANPRVQAITENLRDITRLFGASTVNTSRSLGDIASEHAPIIDAIELGDRAAAEKAMRRHIECTGRLLIQQAVRERGDDIDPETLWADLTR